MEVHKIIMLIIGSISAVLAFYNGMSCTIGGTSKQELIAGISSLILGIIVFIDRKQRIENDEELSRYHITFAAFILMGIGLIIHYLLEKIF